jgi:hypothetical protein
MSDCYLLLSRFYDIFDRFLKENSSAYSTNNIAKKLLNRDALWKSLEEIFECNNGKFRHDTDEKKLEIFIKMLSNNDNNIFSNEIKIEDKRKLIGHFIKVFWITITGDRSSSLENIISKIF